MGNLPSSSLLKDDRLMAKSVHPDASDYSGSDDDDDDGESIGSYSSRSSSGVEIPGDSDDDDDDDYYRKKNRGRFGQKRFKSNHYHGYYKHPFK